MHFHKSLRNSQTQSASLGFLLVYIGNLIKFREYFILSLPEEYLDLCQ